MKLGIISKDTILKAIHNVNCLEPFFYYVEIINKDKNFKSNYKTALNFSLFIIKDSL